MTATLMMDSLIENGTAQVYASSQSSPFCLPVNKDEWAGSAKLYPAGIFRGADSISAWVKVYAVGSYTSDALPSTVAALPTKPVYNNKTLGNSVIIHSRLPTGGANPEGFKLTLIRTAGGTWDAVYESKSTPAAAPAGGFEDEYDASELGLRWAISGTWNEGDTITCYFYQIQVKISVDGGATFGSAVPLFPPDSTWSSFAFDFDVDSGLKINFRSESQTAPAVVNDVVKLVAGYNEGVHQLHDQDLFQHWRASRKGTQALMVDAGANQTIDYIAALELVGAVSIKVSTSANLINSCVGTLKTVGTSCELTHDGTWSSSTNGGTLYVRSGAGMGKSYTISSVATSQVNLSSNPASDGVVAGDSYMIVPTSGTIVFQPESTDNIKFFTSTSARCVWVTVAGGDYRSSIGLCRIGEAFYPYSPPLYIQSYEIEFLNDLRKSVAGNMSISPIGYAAKAKSIEWQRILRTDRDDLVDEIETYNGIDFARFVLFIPYTGDADSYIYGAVNGIESPDIGEKWAELKMVVVIAPSEL
jgi:hypothetical protein